MKKIYRYNAVKPTTNLLFNLFFFLFCLTCIAPFLIITAASFSTESDLVRYGYGFWPKVFSTEAWKYLSGNMMDIVRAYEITIFNTVFGTCIHLLICSMCAYPLSRQDFHFKGMITKYFVFTMLFSGGTVPWYLVCTRLLGLQDTIWAMIVPQLCSVGHIIILRTFMKTTIPAALTESAQIEGAGDFMIFFKIILPLSLPGLATIGLFTGVGYWNDWTLPLWLINNSKLSNLQYYLQRIMSNAEALTKSAEMGGDVSGLAQSIPTENVRMAVCLLAIGPIVLFYPFLQKYFIKGLTIGAVKG